MRTRREFIVLLGGAAAVRRSSAQDRPARILYFTHSAGYRHDVISTSRDVLQRIGATADFQITMSEDVAVFTTENLLQYGGIMFFTTGELPLSDSQRRAFTDFIRAGGGFLGVHSATCGRNIGRSLAATSTSIPGIRRWSSRSQIVMTRWWPSWAKRLPSQMKSIRFATSTWAAHACCYASIRLR
jgi:hypothetical protein